MTQFAVDAFTGASGTELSAYSASWVRHSGSTVGVNAVLTDANRCRSDASGGAIYYHTATPASADYSASVDIYEASNPSVFSLGVLVRVATAATTFYMARHIKDSTIDAWQLHKVVAGVYTQLGANVTDAITTGTSKTLKLVVSGSTTTALTLYSDGVSKLTYSDSTTPITAAGKAGMRHGYGASDTPTNTTLYHADNFSADEVISITVSPSAGTITITGFSPAVIQSGAPAQQQILNALKALLLAGNTVASTRVFLHRVDPLQPDELPAIVIEEGDSLPPETIMMDGGELRSLDAIVYCTLASSDTAPADCKSFGLAAEILISTDPILRNLCQFGVSLLESSTITNGDGDRLLAASQQKWRFAYYVHPHRPDIINPT